MKASCSLFFLLGGGVFLAGIPSLVFAVDSYTIASGASTEITEHSVCRLVTNNHASGSSIMVPTKTAAEWSSGVNAFINAPPAGVTVAGCGCVVTPNSQSFSTAGSHNFTVPCYNTLTVQVWGGGGGGGGQGGAGCTAGGPAQQSSFNSTLIANGGGGGVGSCWHQTGGGSGGSASGGTVNTSGSNGGNGTNYLGGTGGASPNGGGTRTMSACSATNGNPGNAPGGGGTGGCRTAISVGGSGGGGGGYSSRTYSAGQLTVGASLPLVVGNGGNGGNGYGGNGHGGAGAVGQVTITWN